jgi:tRNA (cmo5U34)-methyltransferase
LVKYQHLRRANRFMNISSPTDSGFDRVAWLYDFLSFLVFGNTLRKAQTAFLDLIPANARILLIGGGSGWLLKQILLRYSPDSLVYIEASPRMLSLAKRKTRALALRSVVDFRLGNEQLISSYDRFDIVITAFFLDLFTQQRLQQEIMPRLSASLLPDGKLLFADFIPSDYWVSGLLIRAMYCFFGTLANIEARQLPDYTYLFQLFNLQKTNSSLFFKDMVEASVWEKGR